MFNQLMFNQTFPELGAALWYLCHLRRVCVIRLHQVSENHHSAGPNPARRLLHDPEVLRASVHKGILGDDEVNA